LTAPPELLHALNAIDRIVTQRITDARVPILTGRAHLQSNGHRAVRMLAPAARTTWRAGTTL
jgi:hypothetical protein